MNPPRYGQAEPRVSFPPPVRSRTTARPAVPDPRFRDQLAQLLLNTSLRSANQPNSGAMALEQADALMPTIAAEVEARVQAAANQRAVEQLWAAADEVGVPAYWRRRLNARAAALASPAPAPRAEEGQA